MVDEPPDSTSASRRRILRTISAGAIAVGGLGALGSAAADGSPETAEASTDDDRCQDEYRCNGRQLQVRTCCNYGDYTCDSWRNTGIAC